MKDSERLDLPSASEAGPRITVVILARNEEKTIADIVSSALPFADEILVMDGRSDDQTPVRASDAGATVHTDPGLGKGSGIRASLDLARGEAIVFMDADGSHAAPDIARLAAPILTDEADLVVGSRFAGGSEELSVNFPQLIRSIGNISMNIAINERFGVQLTDTLNGYRAIRSSIAKDLELKENRHTIEQEMVIQALRRGYRVQNIPSHEYARVHGESTINVWREWPKFVWCLIRNLVQPRVFSAPPDREPDSQSDDDA